MLKRIRALARDKCGGTAIEYGLIAAIIVIGIMISVTLVATRTIDMWDDVSVKIRSVN
jgi:pilus assembly protein Flp/PilA